MENKGRVPTTAEVITSSTRPARSESRTGSFDEVSVHGPRRWVGPGPLLDRWDERNQRRAKDENRREHENPNWWRRTTGVAVGFIVGGRVLHTISTLSWGAWVAVPGTALLVAGLVTDRPLNPLCATSRWTASANTAGYSPSSSTRVAKACEQLAPERAHDDDWHRRRRRSSRRPRRRPRPPPEPWRRSPRTVVESMSPSSRETNATQTGGALGAIRARTPSNRVGRALG
jgi:hypothetical protein